MFSPVGVIMEFLLSSRSKLPLLIIRCFSVGHRLLLQGSSRHSLKLNVFSYRVCVCLCEVIAGEILYQVLVCVHVHVIFSTIMYVVLAKVCKSTMVCVLALYESQSGLYRDVCGCTCIYSLTVHVCKP